MTEKDHEEVEEGKIKNSAFNFAGFVFFVVNFLAILVTTQVSCLLPYMDQGNRVAVNHADTVGSVQKRRNRTKRLTT